MKQAFMSVKRDDGRTRKIPLVQVHTLVLGSGAAGLNAAVQLRANGVEDVLILTEGLKLGTSINTGSDKQTYYKLSLYGVDADAPAVMAETFHAGGSMHGDLALVEAALSARGFLHLVSLGVPFPRDRYGQFVGYKTDHDPRQRATSIGPYTSREMCRALIRRVQELKIPVRENRHAVQLLTVPDFDGRRAAGVVVMDAAGHFEAYIAENVVFAVGGPGGLYQTSVYPVVHTGAIGLALMAGAKARGLPESQYGLASTKFRWNVSGTYMQVIPRFISTAADGRSDEQEFLRPYFDSVGQMNSMVFLKGYQWPFDSRKAQGGSSLVDILVYIETVIRGRRVFLDFRTNPEGFAFDTLSGEARQYLERSEAMLETPIARLQKMNPGAIELYRDHRIDITREPLEIAVCAQHNNGGLAADLWWESENIRHLFPVGEVNGSHGVYRPGGSALNAGQVGSLRAAECIANRYANRTLSAAVARRAAQAVVQDLDQWLDRGAASRRNWKSDRVDLQARMSRAGAHIRPVADLDAVVQDAWERVRVQSHEGYRCRNGRDRIEALQNRQLCFAHAVYLESIRFAVQSGAGSRGSSLVLSKDGQPVYDRLPGEWRMIPENPEYRDRVQETTVEADGRVVHQWAPCRPIPACDGWFETSWAAFRNGSIYR